VATAAARVIQPMIGAPAFDFATLRRYPEVEAANLFAHDSADRLILDEAGDALATAAPGEVAVIGDAYGALTLGSGALHVRVFQDSIVSESALANNAPAGGSYRSLGLDRELLEGARIVLLKLPKGLDGLDDIAASISEWASDDVVVFAGGRIKHMTLSMNEVLSRHFGKLEVRLARQKSRVLVASSPITTGGPVVRRTFDDELRLWVCATGSVFAGARVDIGTRALLAVLDQAAPDARSAADLGCGTGVLAAELAKRRPGLAVLASDASASAVASTRATIAANRLDNVTVTRDNALAAEPAASLDLVVLNPPFHLASTVHTGAATKLFEAAARVLAPGGELWTVYNSHLGYRGELERVVGPTREVSRNSKFTVTVSKRVI